MKKEELHTVGIHFLEFAVSFLSLAKTQYQQENGIKANSLSFYVLLTLENWKEQHFTMSELADQLQIPKQQLSRLINDLEEKQLVERIHDRENRRRVYIRICEPGKETIEDLKQHMLDCTVQNLNAYTEEELEELDHCVCRLNQLIAKFNPEEI